MYYTNKNKISKVIKTYYYYRSKILKYFEK